VVLPDGQLRTLKSYALVESKRLIGINYDITERKQTEEALRESQQFLQTVLDTIPLGIFWKDRNSVYLGGNTLAAHASGFSSSAELIGKTDYDLPWGATEGDLYRQDDQRVMLSEEAKLGIVETQLRDDGSQRWIETNKLPLRNLKNEVVGVLGTFQDITARKQAELALQESQHFIQKIADASPNILYV